LSSKPTLPKPKYSNSFKLNNALAYWRKDKGLTQLELANQLGIERLFISVWENDHSLPTHEQMEQIAAILEKPVAVIFVR
jgi:transcriptional regulator with XRE-family HTH domain